MWQVGMGVLMVVEPLKVGVSTLPTIRGVFNMHSTYLWNSFKSYDKLPRGSNEETKKFTRVST